MKLMWTAVRTGLVLGIIAAAPVAQAHEVEMPKDMVYVGQGPSVMGLDRAESATPNRRLSLYDKRMNMPWSAEAFHDEGPAHTVFLDSYLIDKYEV